MTMGRQNNSGIFNTWLYQGQRVEIIMIADQT